MQKIDQNSRDITVLGIETSCDETALAIVSCKQGHPRIEHNEIYSQIKEHERYGGVVPELAARAHIDKLPLLVRGLPLDTLDAITATTGPGLIGGLHIGYGFGHALALALHKPFYPAHHLEAHALTARLTDRICFPYLLLLISGGHTQIIDVQDFRHYRLLGESRDDSCGEVFDKTAKLLGLPFPGGPAIERAASSGDPLRYPLPCPFYKQPHCDFSFSGLKTAIKECIADTHDHSDPFLADICASLHHTIGKILIDRLTQAFHRVPHKQLVIAGGVAANQHIRTELTCFCEKHDRKLIVPPVSLCTDNAAMIAWAGIEMIQHNLIPETITPRPRWPLVELSKK